MSDDIPREIIACAAGWESDARIIGNVKAGDIAASITALLDEIESLRRWKAEAIEVDDQWETLFQAVGAKPSDLGRIKRDIVLDELLRLRAENQTLRKGFRAARRRLMAYRVGGRMPEWTHTALAKAIEIEPSTTKDGDK